MIESHNDDDHFYRLPFPYTFALWDANVYEEGFHSNAGPTMLCSRSANV